MPSTGAITIAGKTYTWTSPTIASLELAEQEAGLKLPDLAFINSPRGKCALLLACLREHHSDLTYGVLCKELRAEDLAAVSEILLRAVPLWAPALGAAPSPTGSSQPAGGSSDGAPATRGESA